VEAQLGDEYCIILNLIADPVLLGNASAAKSIPGKMMFKEALNK